MSSFKHLIYIVCVMVFITLTSCGSSSSTVTTTDDTTDSSSGITSLSQLPNLTDMITSEDSTSSSLSGALLAVSGTAPALSEIDNDSVDTLFWDGLLAEMLETIDDPSYTQDQVNAFWDGEMACRMAQEVGYSLQNLAEGGTSLCYMKNAPNASSGVDVVSGDITEDDLPTLFNTQTDTFIGKVVITGQEFEGASGPESQDEDIYIRIYGSSTETGANGYAADLIFCEADSTGTPSGYEQIRVNSETGVITQTNYNNHFGTFLAQFTGSLTTDDEGAFVFNRDEAQTVQVFFAEDQDDFSFSFKSLVSTLDGELTTKSWGFNQFDGDATGHKVYSVADYSGATQDTFALSSAEFSGIWNYGDEQDSFSSLIEFQDSLYATSDGDFTSHDFASDSFFDGSEPEADSTVVASLSDFSCDLEADFVVSMDMSDEGFQEEVSSLCEAHFDNMNFCDSDEINSVREAIYASDFFGEDSYDPYDE